MSAILEKLKKRIRNLPTFVLRESASTILGARALPRGRWQKNMMNAS